MLDKPMVRPPCVLDDDISTILVDETTIQQRVAELGAAISAAYAGRDLVLVSVLKGSIIFMADLVRSITVPHEIDFMATSSYGAATSSSGVVRILKDLNVSIQDRNVLVVEDIIDSGHTLTYLLRLLSERQPASLRIVTLLDKPERRAVHIDVDLGGLFDPE